QFAVLALVVLPLLPDRDFGPFNAINARQLWIVVLLFSGLSFVGYVAQRVIGDERGYTVTGLIGGMVSSTAVAFEFSRKSKSGTSDKGGTGNALGFGVIAACTVLLVRVVAVSAVLQQGVAVALLPFVLPPFVAGAIFIALVLWWHHGHTQAGATK